VSKNIQLEFLREFTLTGEDFHFHFSGLVDASNTKLFHVSCLYGAYRVYIYTLSSNALEE
jgi:hypothetical protein